VIKEDKHELGNHLHGVGKRDWA